MSQDRLSHDDVSRLLAERSADARVETANKLTAEFEAGELSASERQLAEEIFRLMVRDAEVRVRQALAVNLKESAALPHDVALALAHDVDTVALPILQFSKVLTDADLIEIVRNQGVVKQVAIARRPEVSLRLADALIETHSKDVVTNLVANEGADLSERAIRLVEDEFRSDSAVRESLKGRARLPDAVAIGIMGLGASVAVQRPSLPVAERLVTMVSEQMQEHLVAAHQLSNSVAAGIVNQSRERATITLSTGAHRDDVEGLVHHLNVNGRLTASIMLRAVCVGDMAFFEAGLAELAVIPLQNVQKLVYDEGKHGFKALYSKAMLPKQLFPAFRCALDVAKENAFDGGDQDCERYCRRMIERILTQYETLGVTFDSNDLEYLLAKMSRLPEQEDVEDVAANREPGR